MHNITLAFPCTLQHAVHLVVLDAIMVQHATLAKSASAASAQNYYWVCQTGTLSCYRNPQFNDNFRVATVMLG